MVAFEDQINHHVDDVSRRAELAVDASRCQLAEEVLVEIALGVALGEGQCVDHVDGRDQQRWLVDHQRGVFHILIEGILRSFVGRRNMEGSGVCCYDRETGLQCAEFLIDRLR